MAFFATKGAPSAASRVAALTPAETQHWLQKWHSNGVAVQAQELLYYRHIPLHSLSTALPNNQSVQSGQQQSLWRGRGMEFDEVRHYQAGDDIRSIDWHVTARTGKTHTKLFREEKEQAVFVCVDQSASMQFGSQLLFKSVFACHLAAALAWNTVQQGNRIGGLFFHETGTREIKPQSRQQGALRFIQTLVQFAGTATQQEQTATPSQQSFHRTLKRLLSLAPPGAQIYLMSDFLHLDEQSLILLKGLKRHCAVTALHISDPFEQELPQATMPLKINDGQHQALLPLHNPAYLKAYQQQSSLLLEQQKNLCQQAGIAFFSLSAAQPLEQQWQQLLKTSTFGRKSAWIR